MQRGVSGQERVSSGVETERQTHSHSETVQARRLPLDNLSPIVPEAPVWSMRGGSVNGCPVQQY
jgi:hypothetical protein